jgi:hypothetical protein
MSSVASPRPRSSSRFLARVLPGTLATALNSSLFGTRYTAGTLNNVGAVAYLGGGVHV